MPHLRLIVAAVLVPFAVWLFLPVPSSGQACRRRSPRRNGRSRPRSARSACSPATIDAHSRRINLLQGDISTLQARQQKIEADLAAKRAELDQIQDDLHKRARLTRLRARLAESPAALTRGSCTCTRPTSPTW